MSYKQFKHTCICMMFAVSTRVNGINGKIKAFIRPETKDRPFTEVKYDIYMFTRNHKQQLKPLLKNVRNKHKYTILKSERNIITMRDTMQTTKDLKKSLEVYGKTSTFKSHSKI